MAGQHQALLTECGLPAEAAGSDRRWTCVLLHGGDLETGWDPSWISADQAARLLQLLDEELPDATGHSLVSELRRRVAKKRKRKETAG